MKKLLCRFLLGFSLVFLGATQLRAASLQETTSELQARIQSFSQLEKIQFLTAALRGPLGSLESWCHNNHHDFTALAELLTLVNNMSNDILSIVIHPQESPIHQILRVCHDCCIMILVLGNYSNNDYEGHSLSLGEDQETSLAQALVYILPWIESTAALHASLSSSSTQALSNKELCLAHKERCLAQGFLSLAHYGKAYLQEKDNRTLAYCHLALMLETALLLTYHYNEPNKLFNTAKRSISPTEFKEQFKDHIYEEVRRLWGKHHRKALEAEYTEGGKCSHDDFINLANYYDTVIEPGIQKINTLCMRSTINIKTLKEALVKFTNEFNIFKRLNNKLNKNIAPDIVTNLFKDVDAVLKSKIKAQT